MFLSLMRWNTFCRILLCWHTSIKWTIVTTLTYALKPAKVASMNLWNQAGADLMPIGLDKYSYNPNSQIKAVNWIDLVLYEKLGKRKKYQNYSVKKFRNKRRHPFKKKSFLTKKNILISKNMDYFGIIL